MKNPVRLCFLFGLLSVLLLTQNAIFALNPPVASPASPASGLETTPVATTAVATAPAPSDIDQVLEAMQKKLPAGWTMKQASETLTIERAGDIWIMNTNRINAAPKLEFPKERQATIKDEGQKTRARMVFKVLPRLTLEQMKVLDDTNALIDAEIASLPEKLGVAAFLDVELSRKVGPVYTATAPEDLKRIEDFQKVREELSAKRMKYPDFNTEKFSLWALEKEGWEDEFHEVHPIEAAQQSYEIYKALESACKEGLK